MKYRILQKGNQFKIQFLGKTFLHKPKWMDLQKCYPPDGYQQTIILYSLETARQEIEIHNQFVITEKKGRQIVEFR